MEIIYPERLPAALECAYCGGVMVVDFMQWGGQCPRCGGSATIDEIAKALSLSAVLIHESQGPTQAVGSALLPAPYGVSGSVSAYFSDGARWSAAGISGAYPDMRVAGIPTDVNPYVCRIDGKRPAWGDSGLCEFHGGGAFIYGEPVTSDNYRRIEKEQGKTIRRMLAEHNALPHPPEPSMTWR
jgi:hypothetical protein